MRRHKEAFLSVLIFFVIWQFLSQAGWIDAELFPTPLSIFKLTGDLLGTFEMWGHIVKSLGRLSLGLLIGWPMALVLAVVTGFSPRARKAFHPFINFGYALPKVALFPLFLVLFGIGETSKVFLIATGVFFLVYIAVFNGLILLLSNPLMKVAQVYNVRGFRFWFHIITKGLVLDIITGTKSAFGYGLVLVVISEAQMSRQGVGYFLWQAWDQFRIIEIYAAILIIGSIGMIASYLFDRMTRTLLSKYTPV